MLYFQTYVHNYVFCVYIYMHSLFIYFTMVTKRRVTAASQLFLKFGAAATRRRNTTVLEPDFHTTLNSGLMYFYAVSICEF